MPGEFYGQRSHTGYSPWGCKESDMTQGLTHTRAHTHTHTHTHTHRHCKNDLIACYVPDSIIVAGYKVIKQNKTKQNKKLLLTFMKLTALKYSMALLLFTTQCKKESEVAQLCPTLCHPMDCSPPGFSICGIFQARILEWVAISFSRDLPDPGIEPRSPTLQADALPSEPMGKPMAVLLFTTQRRNTHIQSRPSLSLWILWSKEGEGKLMKNNKALGVALVWP